MSIHERVEIAVRNAPMTLEFVESTNDLSFFTDKDDDYQLHLNRQNFADLPNEVSFDIKERESLREVLDAYGQVVGSPLSREYVEYAQRHELQHFDAARALGAVAARVGIRIFNVTPHGHESQLTVQPYMRVHDFRTTKFGAALVSAYPIPPSRGDEMDIKSYGYSGVEELADMAMSRNRARKNPASEQFYPVPLSYGSKAEGRMYYL